MQLFLTWPGRSMLTRLEIRNFAVIEHAVFSPSSGLNVISGETGAGKSLLIDAINLIFGEKASKNLIRNDSDRAYVEAVFDCGEDVMRRIAPVMDEYGIPVDDGNIIISRTFKEEGKSVARINGTGVILSQLKRISSELIDIHGQNDNSRIFDQTVHIEMLDRFGGKPVLDLLDAYRDKLKAYKELTVEFKEAGKLASSSSSRVDYLNYAVKEIREAGLKPGEDEELTARKKELSAASRNQSMINDASALVNGQDSNGMTVSGRLSEALRLVKKLAEKDDSFNEYVSGLESISLDLEAFSSDFARKTASYTFSADEERKVNDRLGRIYELQSKYGKTIEDVLAFSDASEKELNEIEEATARVNVLRNQLKETEADLLMIAKELSSERKNAADKMSLLITDELKDLQMPSASFFVKFGTRPKERYFNNNGIDDVTFMFTANPGQPPMDLASTASGGEASRIMLAIKNILSSADMMPTLIFDEIDTGVSGLASLSIAKKLKAISGSHQVLCVSHTAQLAAASDHNFLIEKKTDKDKTYTEIIPLDDEQKIIEVSRLLSGNDDRESRDLAVKMIEELRA